MGGQIGHVKLLEQVSVLILDFLLLLDGLLPRTSLV